MRKLKINNQIETPHFKLLAPDNSVLGLQELSSALKIANDYGLDLVELAPELSPPVCKIMDSAAYLAYRDSVTELAKSVEPQEDDLEEMKEIRLRTKADFPNINRKLMTAREWLQQGKTVKVKVWFRGREREYPELWDDMMAYVAEQLSDIARLDGSARAEGRTMITILIPTQER